MTTSNTQEPQETPPATPQDAPPVSVTVQTAPTDEPASGAALSHADAEVVAEIASDAASEKIEPVIEAVVDAQVMSAKNDYDIGELKEWQATTNQTLETLTEAASSMSSTMAEILTLLQSQAAQPIPPASESEVADAPENQTPMETPADQPPQDNKQEKAKAKRQKSWM